LRGHSSGNPPDTSVRNPGWPGFSFHYFRLDPDPILHKAVLFSLLEIGDPLGPLSTALPGNPAECGGAAAVGPEISDREK